MLAVSFLRGRALGVALALSVTCAVAGCSASMHRGIDLYMDGRAIEAAEAFERTEPRLVEAGATERAQYGLYRGLTFIQLGDMERARQWLAYAHHVARTNPGSLDPDQQELLRSGWTTVDAAPAEGPETTQDAVARLDGPAAMRAPSNGQRSVRPAAR